MKLLGLLFIVTGIFLAGCMSTAPKKSEYNAHFTKYPIKIDGKLTEPAWRAADLMTFQPLPNYTCSEQSFVKIIWDDHYIYVGGIMVDSDIVQQSSENWQHHYSTGDLLEVFLKPHGKKCYWELYSTPNNLKTSFFFPSKGYCGLPECFNYKMKGLKVASSMSGTLNNYSDYDKHWITEIAIPRKELEKHGGFILPGKPWTFLLGRYNYSVHLNNKEVTLNGNPNSGSFHDFKSWNKLNFIKR